MRVMRLDDDHRAVFYQLPTWQHRIDYQGQAIRTIWYVELWRPGGAYCCVASLSTADDAGIPYLAYRYHVTSESERQ